MININDKLYISIGCVFDKNGSFVVQGNTNNEILDHEQRHFDITYLYTCKFIDRLKKEQILTESKIDLIYNNILIELDDFQEKYDASIRNPIQDHSIQIEWDNKINIELSKYN